MIALQQTRGEAFAHAQIAIAPGPQSKLISLSQVSQVNFKSERQLGMQEDAGTGNLYRGV